MPDKLTLLPFEIARYITNFLESEEQKCLFLSCKSYLCHSQHSFLLSLLKELPILSSETNKSFKWQVSNIKATIPLKHSTLLKNIINAFCHADFELETCEEAIKKNMLSTPYAKMAYEVFLQISTEKVAQKFNATKAKYSSRILFYLIKELIERSYLKKSEVSIQRITEPGILYLKIQLVELLIKAYVAKGMSFVEKGNKEKAQFFFKKALLLTGSWDAQIEEKITMIDYINSVLPATNEVLLVEIPSYLRRVPPVPDNFLGFPLFFT